MMYPLERRSLEIFSYSKQYIIVSIPLLGIAIFQDKDATVAGKTCKVYYSFDLSWIMYVWNRVVLRLEVDGENIYEATAVTTDVPAEAFTNHIVAPSWIK